MAELVGPGSRTRPEWFDPAIKTVLDGAVTLGSASGPRDLEQMTAELLGAEPHRVVQEDHDGLWFPWWFEELVSAAAARARDEAGQHVVLLLHGLASIGTPACASIAAGETTPRPVEESWELLCLTHLDLGGDSIFGDESRVVMDNHDLDTTPMIDEFTSWYTGRRGEQPDPDGVAGLAEQWMEGALPETWYAVSPGRIIPSRSG